MHVDAVPRAAERELHPMMHQPFAVGAPSGADLVEQRHGAFLEQAGADAAKHIFRGLALDNDVVDAVKMKKLPKQQSSRTCPYDGYFRAHRRAPMV
jgi:hypothetical protein